MTDEIRPIHEIVDAHYERALTETDGDRSRAAELLGVARYTVQRWINRVGWVDHVTIRERSIKTIALTLGEVTRKPAPAIVAQPERLQANGRPWPRCSKCGSPDHKRQRCGLPARAEPRRRVRQRAVRAKTIQRKQITREELRIGRLMYPVVDIERPKTLADCRDMPRPCPFVGCKHHLYLDINEDTGNIKLNFPDLEPWDLVETCSLDIADRGGITLEEVAKHMNLTRERVRQIETRAAFKARGTLEDKEIDRGCLDLSSLPSR